MGDRRETKRNRNIIEQESTSRAGLVVQTIRSGLEHFFIDQHHQIELLISSSGRGDGGMGKRKKTSRATTMERHQSSRILNSQNYHSKVTKWEILEISHEILELNICEICQQLTILIKIDFFVKNVSKKSWNIKIWTFSTKI